MAKRSHIAVVGSANVDLTTFNDRFPRAGETIFAERFDLGFGGKGANQAVAARLCGADVSMVARVGNGPRVLAIDAHVDVVDTGDLAQWLVPPFSGRISEVMTEVGQYVRPGEPLLRLKRLQNMG